MDEYDVIYLDDDERNARRTVASHSGGSGGRMVVGGSRRPGGSSVIVPPSRRPTVIHSGGGRSRDPRPVVIQEAPQKKKVLGDLTLGEILDLAAQLLAAIQPLPGAPTGAGDVETDVENLVTYQTALAAHAKADERLRTLGGLLGKVLK